MKYRGVSVSDVDLDEECWKGTTVRQLIDDHLEQTKPQRTELFILWFVVLPVFSILVAIFVFLPIIAWMLAH
jgi:hypothetical protein